MPTHRIPGVQVLPQGGHVTVKQIDEMWNLHGA
jgi:hypothetical protein